MTKVGVEGTGSYGVGLARVLRRKGIDVVEVNRPNRQARRNHGKSDPLDAVEAARAALSGRASGAGKTKDGPVEAIRALVVAKRSARGARIKAIVQMRHLGISAPEQLHCRLKGLSVTALVAECTRLRPTRSSNPVTAATEAALSSLGHRVEALDDEIAELDEKIESLLAATAPPELGGGFRSTRRNNYRNIPASLRAFCPPTTRAPSVARVTRNGHEHPFTNGTAGLIGRRHDGSEAPAETTPAWTNDNLPTPPGGGRALRGPATNSAITST